MKQLTISLLFLLASVFSFAQSKTQIGVYAEGGLFNPKGHQDSFSSFHKGSFGGGGLFFSTTVIGRFSASLGLGYRYKQNETTYKFYVNDQPYGGYVPYGYSSYGYGYPYGGYGSYYGGYGDNYVTVDRDFPQHYLVVPLKLRYTNRHHVFLETGIETTWLLNYDVVSKKPEYNWLVGIGFSKYRLQGSVSYVQGFKEQAMGKFVGPGFIDQAYKNRMLMLNLSYPIFGWKK